MAEAGAPTDDMDERRQPPAKPDWPETRRTIVDTLGPCRHPSPLRENHEPFADEADRIVLCSTLAEIEPFVRSGAPLPSFEPAGPRTSIFFDPTHFTAGILTCGGLCPGLNNVVRSIVLCLWYAYGVRRILGFRYGYAGLAAPAEHEPLPLTPPLVEQLHLHGGTLLGSSRGHQDVGAMVGSLDQLGVSALFVIGGDGGLRGASAIAAEITRRRLAIGVVGVPKTIDNDLEWTWRTFGFDTAVMAATAALQGAHNEARAAWDGVGLVKLMGRLSGFIAAHATLASGDVNVCLVPEVPFALHGDGGLLPALERRLDEKHHAVLAVAEGSGQEMLADPGGLQRDASGNVRLKDIGAHLRDEIGRYFQGRRRNVPIRYIDPSYLIRSLPANSFDAQLCLVLGQHAVHAALAGKTNVVVGTWNQRFTHVPIPLAIATRKQLDPNGETWQRVLEMTGQAAGAAAPGGSTAGAGVPRLADAARNRGH
jgi:6-phosphofructokinase 1